MTTGLETVVVGIAQHAALGLVLLAAVAAAGEGWLRLANRYVARPALLHGERLAVAYVLGLAWLVLAALVLLAAGMTVLLPVLLLLPAVLAARAGEGPRLPWRRLGVAVLLALPALLLPLRTGLEWHGPTAVLNGQTFGDTTTYIAQMMGAQVRPLPLVDLRNDGLSFGFLNTPPALIGAALAWLPGVDPFLVFAVMLPTFGIVGVVAAIAAQAPAEEKVGAARALLAGGVLAAALPYLDWLVESPPAALSLPMLPAFAVLMARRMAPLSVSATVTALAALGCLLSKVFLLPVVAAFGLAAATPAAWRGNRILLVALAGGLTLAMLALLVAFRDLLAVILVPGFRPAAVLGLMAAGWDHVAAREAVLLAAEAAAVIALARRLPPLAALAVVVAMGLYWVLPTWTLIGRAAIFVVLAADLAARPAETRGRAAALVAAVAGALAAASWTGFPWSYGLPGWQQLPFGPRLWHAAGLAAGLAMAVCLGRTRGGLPATAAAAMLLVVPAAVAVARYEPRLAAPFTPDLAAAWRAVAERTPADALVFTDQTGPGYGMLEGYNGFAAVGQRQVFVSGWLNSRLMFDDAAREARLRANQEVLAGRLSPAEAAPGRERFFALVQSGPDAPPAPPAFAPVQEVGPYSLYEIGGPAVPQRVAE